MPRYSIRSRVEDRDGWALNPGEPYATRRPQDDESPIWPDVPEHTPTETGILTAGGDMIMRDPRPIGFGRDEDW